ncbi:MAG: D-2-hydroxyacid dehydrogenase [Luteibaculaceae bacterium]
MKILANDGISPEGKQKLEEYGFTVVTENVPQEALVDAINQENYEILLVRSATTARKELIDACPNLKFIGRGGVGMDNIDVKYAREKGLIVENTPASSSQSVAELAMGHLFNLARGLHDANREMPVSGADNFKALKKKYGSGIELRGKTLGIIGFGRIGQSLASYALGIGMQVLAYDHSGSPATVKLSIHGYGEVSVVIEKVSKEELLRQSDFISLHVPAQPDGTPVIGKAEIALMKPTAFLINTARGGSINEDDLIDAINEGKIAGAGLDVFVNEPKPRPDILKISALSLSPHVGAATEEAQDRIGLELAEIISGHFKAVKA